MPNFVKLSARPDVFDVSAALNQGYSFFAGASFVGVPCKPSDPGRLPSEWRSILAAHCESIGYTVFSYDTPIAWRVDTDQGCWVVPDVRYSVSTSQHQSKIRQALGALEVPFRADLKSTSLA